MDMLLNVSRPRQSRNTRDVLHGFLCTDRTTHFYALGGPDFVVGPEAPAAERNILGVIHKVGVDIGKQVIDTRIHNHHVIKVVAVAAFILWQVCLVDGAKPSPKKSSDEFAEICQKNVDFARFSLKVFDDIVLANQEYVDLILADTFFPSPSLYGHG